MRLFRKVDERGLYIEDILSNESEEVTQDELLIKKPIPEDLQLWQPRWNGVEWVEGMSREQIDTLNNVPQSLTLEQEEIKMLKKRLDEAENTVVFLLDMNLTGGIK